MIFSTGRRAQPSAASATTDGGVADRGSRAALAAAKLHEGRVSRGRRGCDLGEGASLGELGALLVLEALPEDLRSVLRGRKYVRFAAAHR
jgi:hypothetical protein